MKIPFDIKYRPQIESGEYKVINRIGEKVRILCCDGPDEDYPIVAFSGEDRSPFTWSKGGRFMTWRESSRDLFIITPEKELTNSISKRVDEKVREEYEAGYKQALNDIKNLIDSNLMPGYAGKIIRLIEQNCE